MAVQWCVKRQSMPLSSALIPMNNNNNNRWILVHLKFALRLGDSISFFASARTDRHPKHRTEFWAARNMINIAPYTTGATKFTHEIGWKAEGTTRKIYLYKYEGSAFTSIWLAWQKHANMWHSSSPAISFSISSYSILDRNLISTQYEQQARISRVACCFDEILFMAFLFFAFTFFNRRSASRIMKLCVNIDVRSFRILLQSSFPFFRPQCHA